MGIVHQCNLVIATLNRIWKKAPHPDQLSAIDINHGIITISGSITAKRTWTKMMVHGPIILDVNVCILGLQIHVPLPMPFHGNVSRTHEGAGMYLSIIIPFHGSHDNQCSQVKTRVHLKGRSDGNDADGIIPTLSRDRGGIDNSRRSLDSNLTCWRTLIVFANVQFKRQIPVGDGIGSGLNGIEVDCWSYFLQGLLVRKNTRQDHFQYITKYVCIRIIMLQQITHLDTFLRPIDWVPQIQCWSWKGTRWAAVVAATEEKAAFKLEGLVGLVFLSTISPVRDFCFRFFFPVSLIRLSLSSFSAWATAALLLGLDCRLERLDAARVDKPNSILLYYFEVVRFFFREEWGECLGLCGCCCCSFVRSTAVSCCA